MAGLYAGQGEPLVPSDTTFRRILGTDDPVLLSGFAREMAVFLYANTKRRERVAFGTGFIVNEPVHGLPGTYWHHLVTARHNIEKIRRVTRDDVVYIRANSRSTGRDRWDEVPLGGWYFHPSDMDATGDEWLSWSDTRRYDVAVAPCPTPLIDDGDLYSWPSYLILPGEGVKGHIGQGDDLAIVGLYHGHIGQSRITPIVRAGMVAAMPSDDLVATEIGPMRAYLIESRSTGGISGSPVVHVSHPMPALVPPKGYQRESELALRMNVTYRIIGLVSAHFDAPSSRQDEPINEGIAAVTPSVDILDTLRQESKMAEREQAEQKLREQSPNVAKLDSFGEDDDRGTGAAVKSNCAR